MPYLKKNIKMISFYCKHILFNLEKIAKYIRNSISPRC